MVGIACMDHKVKLHPNNLVSTMVPWIKRRHAPQFCDEIPNFQCCMTSFSHLVADLLNVRYIPQFWDEMTKFQCCKTSLPHIGAICILYFGNNTTFPDGWSWLYRSQIWQFCDEILNFQCCMTSFLTWSQKIDCMDHRFEFHLYSLGSRLYYSWLAILILGAIFVISITWFLQLCLESNVDICPQEAYCHTNFNMDN